MTQKKRNKLLTLFLIIIFISLFFSIFFNIYIFSNQNKVLVIFNIILSILKMLAIVMIFLWKKIGVYLIFGSTFFNAIINLTLSKNILNIGISLASCLCFLLIFYILVKGDLKYMN